MKRRSFIEVRVQDTRLAFPLEDVQRVVRAVALQAAPIARACLLGAMDVAGQLVSVYDTRRLLGLPGRTLRVTDRIVIASTPPHCALVVDDVIGTVEASAPELSDSFALHAAGVRGVSRARDGLLLVQDLRRLLALERAIPIVSHA